MLRIVGITFNKKSRVYNFDALNFDLNIGDNVIVETEKGLQYGTVVSEPKEIDENEYSLPLKEVIRFATKKDSQTNSKNNQDASKALFKARELVEELKLDMNIIDASFTFDRKQLLFNFLADERIDFRELAKRLAAIYRTRIDIKATEAEKVKELDTYSAFLNIVNNNIIYMDAINEESAYINAYNINNKKEIKLYELDYDALNEEDSNLEGDAIESEDVVTDETAGYSEEGPEDIEEEITTNEIESAENEVVTESDANTQAQ